MKIQKLGGTDGFIVFDLDDAPHSIGITRLAPKILVDGATLLARSTTYLFATFEQQAGGASAGINAKPDDRDAAIAAFVAEVAPLVEAGTFLTEPGRGLTTADLAPLAQVDPRHAVEGLDARSLLGTSVAVAAEKALGGLDGKTVAIEGVDVADVSVIVELAARGASVVAFSTGKGAARDPGGFDAAALGAALSEHGAAAVEQVGAEVHPAPSVLGAEADVLVVSSKPGVLDHDLAADVAAGAVVPAGPVPVTAKALAVLRRRGTVVLPDFITVSGPMFASFPDLDSTPDTVRATAADEVAGALDEVLGHEDGPLLGACYRAESFLRTWQESLPFGRPLS